MSAALTRLRATRALPALAAAAVLAGCSFWGDDDAAFDCESVEEYQGAPLAPTLSIPAGLDRPDASARLDIPAGPLPAEPLSRQAGCLQRPPSYFDKPLAVPPPD